jgi:hypothetical protein
MFATLYDPGTNQLSYKSWAEEFKFFLFCISCYHYYYTTGLAITITILYELPTRIGDSKYNYSNSDNK